MPDDRLFHKRAGHSEKVNKLTDFEELVWRYYIESADDFGVMRFDHRQIQNDHERAANKTPKAVLRALESVRDVGLIRTFEHQGRPYCFQPDWQDWQKIDYPRSTIHPAAPADQLSAKTRDLMAKHPGGWGRKVSGTSGNGSTNVPQTDPEPLGKRSGEITPKPLAVSRQPVAVSREPEPVLATAQPANARGKRPVFRSERFVVFDWMLDDLRRLLGPHAESFGLDEWFFELADRATAEGVMVPQRDGGQWLQEQTLKEAMRRGLTVSATSTNNPKTSGNLAAAARFVARGQR